MKTPDQEKHNSITFDGTKGIIIKTCPRCHRRKWLGMCEDECEMCQSCYHSLHGLAPLPSDFMELPTKLTQHD